MYSDIAKWQYLHVHYLLYVSPHFTVHTPTVPGPVANLAATIVATTSTDTHNITISFEPPPEPNGVVIQYSYAISDTQTTQTVASGMVTMTSIEEISTQIEPYTNYTVSVAAMNPAGVGEESSVTVVSPQAGKSYITTI